MSSLSCHSIPCWGRMGPSGQVVVGQGVKSLLSSEQADFSLLEDIYTCEESSFGPFGFEHCDGALSTAEVTCGSEGKALSDLQMIIEGLDMSIEHYNLAFTPLSSSTEINISGSCSGLETEILTDYVSLKCPAVMEDDSRMCKEGYYTSPSKMEFEDVLEGCSWDGTFSEPLDSGYNTAVPSTTPSLAEDSYFLASLEKLRQMLEISVPSVSEASRQFAGSAAVGRYRATSVDSFDDSPFFSLTPSPAVPASPLQFFEESSVESSASVTPSPPNRKSVRPRKESAKVRVRKSPSSASVSSSAGSSFVKRCGKKVTPKKRGQNVKAARNYRQKKKDHEQIKMKEHELILEERARLLQQQTSLKQELRFAVKMAQARLNRLSSP